MKHSEHRFKGQKDIEIFWQKWLPQHPKSVAVIAHGVGEHSGRYAHVAQALVDAGCAVYAMDHRGHGKSGGARAFVDRFANVVADMDTVVEFARKELPRQPIFMIGHSMGGALALSYTLKHPDQLKGLILSGPAVALDGAPPAARMVAKLLSAIAPKAGILKVDPSLVSRDPAVVADYANDPLVAHGKLGARTMGEIIAFVEILPAGLPLIKLPLLVMHGREDKLAGVSGSELVVKGVQSTDKTLKVYGGLYHEIFNEPERAQVLRDLVEWIQARAR